MTSQTHALDAATLASIPLFDQMTPQERLDLVRTATLVEFQTGDEVVRQNETSQHIWVVLSGKCEVVRANGAAPVVLATLGPHQHFGEMSFFHAAPHSASVRASGLVKVLCLSRTDYDHLAAQGCCATTKLAVNVVACLAERMRRMDDWVADLITEKGGQRKTADWEHFRERLMRNWQL
jgi:CRP-like cAMP-binding protein